MPERRVTLTIHFHADVPADVDDAETMAEQIGDEIRDVLRGERFLSTEQFRNLGVAPESFEAGEWYDEEVV